MHVDNGTPLPILLIASLEKYTQVFDVSPLCSATALFSTLTMLAGELKYVDNFAPIAVCLSPNAESLAASSVVRLYDSILARLDAFIILEFSAIFDCFDESGLSIAILSISSCFALFAAIWANWLAFD